MFGVKERQVVRPVPQVIDGGASFITRLEAYETAAAKVGFTPRMLQVERFKAFLIQADIPIYNTDNVKAYLDMLAKKEGRTWQWIPLRDRDSFRNEHHGYNRPVPLHALRKVQLIEEGYHGKVYFAVSDYVSRNPDPFLAARINAGNIVTFVIDVWDEPGFGIMEMIK